MLKQFCRSALYVRTGETRSSYSFGRSTCYVRFAALRPLVYLPSPSSLPPLTLHGMPVASLLLIRPRTGRSTRRHDVFHRNVTSEKREGAFFTECIRYARRYRLDFLNFLISQWRFGSLMSTLPRYLGLVDENHL